MAVIEINDLSKTYSLSRFLQKSKPVEALRNVSLAIEEKTVYTLLGPNGAGKSTLIRILAGLIPATGGSVKIKGRIGLFTAASQSFWGFMDGRKNLEYFCALQNITGKAARKIIDRMTALFEMGSYIRRRPVWSYSSGMKHRLLLARTLLHDPDILLLDEPVTFLDPIAARKFHILLRERLNKVLKKTILLSTHQLEEAQEISDTLGFLFQGQLLWEKNAAPFRAREANLLNEYLETVKRQLP